MHPIRIRGLPGYNKLSCFRGEPSVGARLLPEEVVLRSEKLDHDSTAAVPLTATRTRDTFLRDERP